MADGGLAPSSSGRAARWRSACWSSCCILHTWATHLCWYEGVPYIATGPRYHIPLRWRHVTGCRCGADTRSRVPTSGLRSSGCNCHFWRQTGPDVTRTQEFPAAAITHSPSGSVQVQARAHPLALVLSKKHQYFSFAPFPVRKKKTSLSYREFAKEMPSGAAGNVAAVTRVHGNDPKSEKCS